MAASRFQASLGAVLLAAYLLLLVSLADGRPQLLYQEKNLGIVHEYSVPARVSRPNPDSCYWSLGDFGPCSHTCGGGVQKRLVYCTSSTTLDRVSDDLCNPTIKPEGTKACNPEPCPVTWYVGKWEECSKTCGNGTQLRLVFCQHQTEVGSVLMEDSHCLESVGPKPERLQECSSDVECASWEAGNWTECSTPCGGGLRTRTVICQVNRKRVAARNCDMGKKPFDTESCNMNACDEDEVIVLGGCKDSKHGCCPDGVTPSGANFEGCPKVTPVEGGCKATEFGCCLDGVNPAFGPFMKGCEKLSFCNGTQFGCCPDGETAAKGPDDEGCFPATTEAIPASCNATEWGCCPDGTTAVADSNQTNCAEITTVAVLPCADSQFGCCPDNVTAADGPGGLNCIEGSGTEEPCHATTHGCCPDGWSVAQGPNNEGCPDVFQVTPEMNCSASTHGCCPDGVSPALGPEGLGCDDIEGSGTEPTDCENTLFGCCPDGKTWASGMGFEGCSNCTNSTFGCCPDGVTAAAGEAFEGCVESCEATIYGCCPDKITAANGPGSEGCGNCTDSLYGCCEDKATFAMGPSGEGCCVVSEFGCCLDNITEATADGCLCNGTAHGCCPDNVTIALGPELEGCTCEHYPFGCCPDKKSPAEGPDFQGCVDCTNTTFGCCPDDLTAALGPNFEGCEGYETNCTNTTFGCCPDGVQAAEGENFVGCAVACESTPFGCCPDGLAPASGIGFEGCDNCSESLYGCCADNTSFALGPDGEGCCFHTEFGCCQDNKTEARGPDRAGCSCHTTPHGCCPDGIAVATGPKYYGCTCHNYPYGCCQDRRTPAGGPNFEGCICSRLMYGCCPDNVTPARGPKLAGCGCETMPYGCCPDQQTPARGPGFGGCPCTAMPYGCCADRHTAAEGPEGRGCECKRLRYGCCPDGRTPATGPSLTGCTCHHYPHGCCPDGQTPAPGPDADGCTCAMTAYGCCPDGVTAARGRHFEGCPDKRVIPATRNVSASVCGLPKDLGPCRNYTVNWFFSVADGRCNRFRYGGCEGNENRFNSEEECENTCVKPEGPDACQLPKVVGPRDGQYEHWYFNASTRSCESFMYGGRLGNNNRFASKNLCEQTCLHQETLGRNICVLPQEPGNCVELRERWYYNAEEGRCHRFYYGGCDGNENNFATHLECKQACGRQAVTDAPEEEFKQEFCFLPKETGNCTNLEMHWFYDKQDGVCREFYGGCLVNGNRFRSGRDCEERCFSAQDRCMLPKVQGPCSGNFMQWFYDPVTDRCHEFTYGGCQGNANRFNDREACESRCRKGALSPTEHPLDRPTPLVVSPPPRPPTKSGHTIKGACKKMADAGDCNQVHARWFYDIKSGRCLPFVYTGCGGNKNRFKSAEICMKFCSGVTMDSIDRKISEPDTDKKWMTPSPPEFTDTSEELDPRIKPPMFVTPLPERSPLTPPTLPQTPAQECLPSNCEELQCPLGKNKTVDHRGCVQCRCSNPCETFSCHEQELCRIEAYRSADGKPHYRPVCRLVKKPGQCPVPKHDALPAAVVRADCRDFCRVDADCPDVRKCCDNAVPLSASRLF